MIKQIDFPPDEQAQLQKQTEIVTTRVSKEYNRYHKGELVLSPWKELYVVSSVQKINEVKKHPYYKHLTVKQIRLISGYKRIDVIILKKAKTA